jgi:hypothetical protein
MTLTNAGSCTKYIIYTELQLGPEKISTKYMIALFMHGLKLKHGMEGLYFSENTHGQLKCKAVPLQAWSGPESSRKLRFPDFMTMAQDSGTVVSLMHRPHLPPGNSPGTYFCLICVPQS